MNRHLFGDLNQSEVGSKIGGSDYLLQFLEPVALTESKISRVLLQKVKAQIDLFSKSECNKAFNKCFKQTFEFISHCDLTGTF